VSDRREPTPEQLVGIVAETLIDRLHVLRRAGETVDFNNVARLLGEIINEQIDAGNLMTDEQLEQLRGMPDELDETTKGQT